MGCNLKDLIVKKAISISDIANKTLAVDSYNLLYQFLTTIRQADGSLLTDSKGNVTSHLIGLFNRTVKLMESNIRMIFVFDGTPPKLKIQELQKRRTVKEEAKKQYEIAKERKDITQMKKYASRFTILTEEMKQDAQKLITLLGMPIVQAPSEGEAQVAQLVKDKSAFAAVSQDYDTLLYKTPKLIQNLSIAGRRKRIHGKGTITVSPEIIELKKNLDNLKINQDQLIVLAILVGTDYNPGGVRGIGPKTALKLVREHKNNFDAMFKKVEFPDWKKIYETIKKMPVAKDYKIKFNKIDKGGLKEFLIKERGFSNERVDSALEKLQKSTSHSQKALAEFL